MTSDIYVQRSSYTESHTHLDQFIGEILMEDSIDSGTSWQINSVYFVTWALNQLLKVNSQVLN